MFDLRGLVVQPHHYVCHHQLYGLAVRVEASKRLLRISKVELTAVIRKVFAERKVSVVIEVLEEPGNTRAILVHRRCAAVLGIKERKWLEILL